MRDLMLVSGLCGVTAERDRPWPQADACHVPRAFHEFSNLSVRHLRKKKLRKSAEDKPKTERKKKKVELKLIFIFYAIFK